MYSELYRWINRNLTEQINYKVNCILGGRDVAINAKGKRKIVFNNEIYYWFVRIEKDGSHRIHILTEDKKVNGVYPTADTEVPVTSEYICKILKNSGV